MLIRLEVYGMEIFFPDVQRTQAGFERAGEHIKRDLIQVLSDDRMKLVSVTRGQDCSLDEISEISFGPLPEDDGESG